MSNQQEALKTARADSLGRRPAIASATTPTGTGRTNREYEGRRSLGNGSRIKVERIRPDPEQPRRTFPTESLDRLAENMRTRGQLVPILVRWCPDQDIYLVIDGERRYRAALQAGLAEMACVVENESDPGAILEMQLIANALREDVAPVEQARSWERLMSSQGLTHRQLAEKLGYDHTMINKSLALLNLAPAIQARVDSGEIAASTGGVIAKLDNAADQQAIAERVVSEGLNRSETVEAVRQVADRRPTGRVVKGKEGASKTMPQIITSRTFKGESGLRITAARARGIDLAALLIAMEQAVEQIRGELGGAG